MIRITGKWETRSLEILVYTMFVVIDTRLVDCVVLKVQENSADVSGKVNNRIPINRKSTIKKALERM